MHDSGASNLALPFLHLGFDYLPHANAFGNYGGTHNTCRFEIIPSYMYTNDIICKKSSKAQLMVHYFQCMQGILLHVGFIYIESSKEIPWPKE